MSEIFEHDVRISDTVPSINTNETHSRVTVSCENLTNVTSCFERYQAHVATQEGDNQNLQKNSTESYTILAI
jgi:hypothetical protein